MTGGAPARYDGFDRMPIAGRWAAAEFTTDHWVSVQRTAREFPI